MDYSIKRNLTTISPSLLYRYENLAGKYTKTKKAIIIVPRTAETCTIGNKYELMLDTSETYYFDLASFVYAYKVVLPGQALNKDGKYSFESAVDAVKESLKVIFKENKDLVGGIGICTGLCILIEAVRQMRSNLYYRWKLRKLWKRLQGINTAAVVSWNTEYGQKKFSEKYKTKLDNEALMHAPMPKDIIAKYLGKIMQILCGGESDYKLKGKPGREGQEEMKNFNPRIEQYYSAEFGNMPDPHAECYEEFMHKTCEFFDIEI